MVYLITICGRGHFIQTKEKSNNMKHLCCIVGVFWGMMCLSCTKTHKEIIFPQSESVKVNLLGDSSIIGNPIEMVKYDDLLLINDYQGDSLIWVFNVSKNEMVNKWVSRGNGPDEFLPPIHMVLIDSVLAIQGRPTFTSRKYQINLSSLTLEGVTPLIHFSTGADMIDRFYPLKESIYIASGIFDEKRYAIVNPDGKIVQYFGNYPNYMAGENQIPIQIRFFIHQPEFTYNSQRAKIAGVSNYILDIINFSENQPNVEKQILLSSYTYSFVDNRLRKADYLSTGALYTCSTHEYIFIVYDPNIEDDRNRSKKERANPQIWIFDWNGNPVKKILPDLWVDCIYVENDNQTVYCITDFPEPTLATFTIKW